MPRRLLLCSFLMITTAAMGCGSGTTTSPPTSSSSITSELPKTTTPTTTAAALHTETFGSSVNDVIAQINLQLPLLEQGSSPLPRTIIKKGVFGGRVTPDTKIYLLPESSAFSKTRAVTVHVTGNGGAVQTPARLLSGIGASLSMLSSEAIEAFGKDALPQLSTLTKTRTTITVGSFYDLTILVRDSASLVFIYTPVGATPPSEAETLGL